MHDLSSMTTFGNGVYPRVYLMRISILGDGSELHT